MKSLTWLLASGLLLRGCTAGGPLYYHERSDGTRYYQTVTEQVVRVDKDGRVVEAPIMYGGAARQPLRRKGADWDVSTYGVVAPPGHCTALLGRKAESCLHRIWEAPALILMAPVLFLPDPPLLFAPYPDPPATDAPMSRR